MHIEQVKNQRQLRQFVFFPETLYRQIPQWAPPIWLDELNSYRPGRNPILANADCSMFLARHNDKILGRNLVYVDRSFNEYWQAQIGFFGAFECVNNDEAARALLRASEVWLAERGMTASRGPIHPIAECWGFLWQGYDLAPVFMAPYNPPYYHDLVAGCGYGKVKDLLAYEADATAGYQIPERFTDFCQKLLARHANLSVRRVDTRNLQQEAEHIWEISNIALRHNWGYVPVDRGVLQDMVKKLKPILEPDAVWFVLDGKKPVGYTLGYPDINGILQKIRGRLFPLGFLRLLLGRKSIRRFRLFALAVLPEYHNLGLDVLLYVSLFQALAPKGIFLEANYILEDNFKIRNALEKLNLRLSKTYRIYEKPLV